MHSTTCAEVEGIVSREFSAEPCEYLCSPSSLASSSRADAICPRADLA